MRIENPQLHLFKLKFKSDESQNNKEDWVNCGFHIGLKAELIFELISIEKRWQIAKALNPIAPYDYLIYLDDQWRTVQVKTIYNRRTKNGYEKIGRLYHGSKRSNYTPERRYKEGDFDLLFTTDGNQHWLIPYYLINNMWTLTLDSPKYIGFEI